MTSTSTRTPIYKAFAKGENIGDVTAKGECVGNIADLVCLRTYLLFAIRTKHYIHFCVIMLEAWHILHKSM